MVGLIEDRSKIPASGFVAEGDEVLLLGPPGSQLGCSEYLALRLGRSDDLGPPPSLDLDVERAAQTFVREAARRGLLRSAHDCSEGGLAVAIAECCIAGDIGFRGALPIRVEGQRAREAGQSRRTDAALFGEGQSRFVITCRPEDLRSLFDLFGQFVVGPTSSGEMPETPWLGLGQLGRVGGDTLSWSDDLSVPVKELARAWNTPF
jgi:phosphoribosylformylglycinamidine synthase